MVKVVTSVEVAQVVVIIVPLLKEVMEVAVMVVLLVVLVVKMAQLQQGAVVEVPRIMVMMLATNLVMVEVELFFSSIKV